MSTIIGLVSTFRLPLHFIVSRSNSPLSCNCFGPPTAFYLLQGPICHFLAVDLDFQQPFLCLSVQSTKSPHQLTHPTSKFYSSTCIWHAFIAVSALTCDSGVTPAHHSNHLNTSCTSII